MTEASQASLSNLLHAFINEVNAQAGKHIVADHAIHLVDHAGNVITALGG